MQTTRTTFDSIRPGDVDTFAFDFSEEIGAAPLAITDATWTCVVSPTSFATDPDAATRLIGSAIFDRTKTSHRAGEMLGGVIYTLTATVEITDGRVLSADGDIECAIEPITGVVPRSPAWAPWNFTEFTAQHPEFNPTDPDLALSWWNAATGLHANDGRGPVTDLQTQKYLLYLLTAHIGARAPGGIGAGAGVPSFLVGAITSASQGPISVSSTPITGGGALGAWFNTTAYGSQYWALTAPFRLFRYRPGLRRVIDPYLTNARRLGF
jgi:hypothetical protein